MTLHFRNPLAIHANQMARSDNDRRIKKAQRTLFETAVRCYGDPLNHEQRSYMSHLCGIPQGGFTELTLEDKARLGKLFDNARNRLRSELSGLTAREIPGLDEVPHIRALVRARHKQAEEGTDQYRRK